jgi:hypothetical protein
MKHDLSTQPMFDTLFIDNGEFEIELDRARFSSTMERKTHSREEILALWDQFVRFAHNVEISRAHGLALGSSDPDLGRCGRRPGRHHRGPRIG